MCAHSSFFELGFRVEGSEKKTEEGRRERERRKKKKGEGS
jgi:hypothetical protein